MKLAEEMKIVPLLTSANIGATTDCDSINMSGFHRATFICTCGAFTGDGTFSVNCGTTEGAKTTAVLFKHALGGAAIGTAVAGSTASCDVLAAESKTTAIAPTAAITCTTKMVVIEVDASEMDISNGYEWLTLTAAATAGILHVVAILEPRYSGNRSATCLK
jgi:hypothetical protein